MAISGSLTYDTKLDTKGFQSGLNKIGGIAKGVAVGVGASITAIGTGLSVLVKNAVDNYAEYEQLVGGVDTLFKESSQKLQGYAAEAYKTAQISANEYMNTVTSFSASLLQSLGGDTDKAAEYANRAIIDMSDNANKMGTSMEMIQNAYQGFAKQNYTMLDNLKLGYGGTKEEMERLITDASQMTDIQEELNLTVEDGNLSFANIVNAISVMQKSLDIAGTSAKEASTTIEGSTNMMKASWNNLVTGIADDNADFDKLIDNFVESAGAMLDNLLPRILIAIEGLGELIPKLGTIILEHLPEIMETGQNIINGLMQAIVSALPTLITTGTQILQSLLNGIIQYLPQIMPIVIQVILSLVNFITQNLPTILQAGITILLELIKGITEAIPNLIPAIVQCIETMLTTLIEHLPDIIMAGIDLLLALAEGILDALPDLIAIIPDLIIALVTKLLSPEMLLKLASVGPKLMIALAKALINNIPNLIMAIPEIIIGLFNGFRNTIANTDWLQLGKNVLNGILSGITSMGRAIKNAAKKVVNSIKDNIKSFFGIHSPSKVMRDEIGKNLILGVGVAFEKDDDLIDKQINDFGDDVYKKMQGAVNMETGKMAFSGTAGSVSQILSSNATFDGNFVVKAEVEEGTLFEAQQRITRQKNLQTGFGG